MILVLAPAVVVVVVTNISIGSIGSMIKIKDSVGFDEFVIHCLMIDVPLFVFVLAVCLVLSVSKFIKDRSNDYSKKLLRKKSKN